MTDLVSLRDTPMARGLRQLLEKLEDRLQLTTPVHMFIAGGMAVHLYCGSRVSSDVDAEFTARVFLPSDLVVSVVHENGNETLLHFDSNYNSTFALMHEDYTKDAVPLDIKLPHLQVHLLSPVDLAVSKIARLQDVDRGDIRELVMAGLTSSSEIEARAKHALVAFVGNVQMLRVNLDEALEIARQAERERALLQRNTEGGSVPRG